MAVLPAAVNVDPEIGTKVGGLIAVVLITKMLERERDKMTYIPPPQIYLADTPTRLFVIVPGVGKSFPRPNAIVGLRHLKRAGTIIPGHKKFPSSFKQTNGIEDCRKRKSAADIKRAARLSSPLRSKL